MKGPSVTWESVLDWLLNIEEDYKTWHTTQSPINIYDQDIKETWEDR